MVLDKYKESELLRMNKNELIEHIFYLYKVNECQWNEICEWYNASEKIQELRKEKCDNESC